MLLSVCVWGRCDVTAEDRTPPTQNPAGSPKVRDTTPPRPHGPGLSRPPVGRPAEDPVERAAQVLADCSRLPPHAREVKWPSFRRQAEALSDAGLLSAPGDGEVEAVAEALKEHGGITGLGRWERRTDEEGHGYIAEVKVDAETLARAAIAALDAARGAVASGRAAESLAEATDRFLMVWDEFDGPPLTVEETHMAVAEHVESLRNALSKARDQEGTGDG